MAGISLSGLASGLDTNSIVDQLMAIERNKVVKQNLRTRLAVGHVINQLLTLIRKGYQSSRVE